VFGPALLVCWHWAPLEVRVNLKLAFPPLKNQETLRGLQDKRRSASCDVADGNEPNTTTFNSAVKEAASARLTRSLSGLRYERNMDKPVEGGRSFCRSIFWLENLVGDSGFEL
jgi:hypothetical protein